MGEWVTLSMGYGRLTIYDNGPIEKEYFKVVIIWTIKH
jgi:hypothetical protein